MSLFPNTWLTFLKSYIHFSKCLNIFKIWKTFFEHYQHFSDTIEFFLILLTVNFLFVYIWNVFLYNIHIFWKRYLQFSKSMCWYILFRIHSAYFLIHKEDLLYTLHIFRKMFETLFLYMVHSFLNICLILFFKYMFWCRPFSYTVYIRWKITIYIVHFLT